MTIDTELVTEVQLLADEARTHRVKTLIACYVGFISLLESNPELEERARQLEKTLRAFRSTGVLPLSPAEAAAKTEPSVDTHT
jgi:hypothetical protein